MKIALFLLLWASSLYAQTTVVFQPSATAAGGPFPTDALTTPDSTQKTGLRINLAAATDTCDPLSSPSVCSNVSSLNQLDGFSVNPRVMVCFSGPVQVSSLQSGISLVPEAAGGPISINQVIYDPNSNCAFAKPNQVLNQQSQYVLEVTTAVHDNSGQSVAPDPEFQYCLSNRPNSYCAELANALQGTSNVVGASVFTTMSATTWLERVRDFIDLVDVPVLMPAGFPFEFQLANLKSFTWNRDQSGLPPMQIPLDVLSNVDSVAFGLFLSPSFLDPSNGTIPTNPTNFLAIPGVPPNIPFGLNTVSFHVFLPMARSMPAGGFPVVIYGHGLSDNQFGAPTYIASTLAKNGFATLAMEITGHGYGSGSTVQLTTTSGQTFTEYTPGRGILLPGNSTIGSGDGCIIGGAVAERDCARQTAADLITLVKTIQQTNGLGINLDPNRIYYVGQSFGATYGTLFHAVEPSVRAAILNGDGGSSVDVARLGITGRALGVEYLNSVNPALLNVISLGAPSQAYYHDQFNDNYVFRDGPPVVNSVPGAIAIQGAFEAAEWLGILGDPLGYAQHLNAAPLNGVPPKSVLFQFGYGDLEVPNPTESAVIRAAGTQNPGWFFHFEEAAGADPNLLGIGVTTDGFPILPHRILSNETTFEFPSETSIAVAEQQQVASYFAGDGRTNPDPNAFLTGIFSGNTGLFQDPSPLPNQVNFLQIRP